MCNIPIKVVIPQTECKGNNIVINCNTIFKKLLVKRIKLALLYPEAVSAYKKETAYSYYWANFFCLLKIDFGF